MSVKVSGCALATLATALVLAQGCESNSPNGYVRATDCDRLVALIHTKDGSEYLAHVTPDTCKRLRIGQKWPHQ